MLCRARRQRHRFGSHIFYLCNKIFFTFIFFGIFFLNFYTFCHSVGVNIMLGAVLGTDGFPQTEPSRHFEFSLFWRLAKERFYSYNYVKCVTELIWIMHQMPGPIRTGQCRPLLPVFGENHSLLAGEGGGPSWFGEAVIQCQWTIRTRTHSIGCDDECKHRLQKSVSNTHSMTAFSLRTFEMARCALFGSNFHWNFCHNMLTVGLRWSIVGESGANYEKLLTGGCRVVDFTASSRLEYYCKFRPEMLTTMFLWT